MHLSALVQFEVFIECSIREHQSIFMELYKLHSLPTF